MRKILGFVVLFIPFVLSAENASFISKKPKSISPGNSSFYNISDFSDYYFSPNGDDQNTGDSPEQAWKSIDKLNSIIPSLKPGDQVFFERGGVWNEAEIELSRLAGTASSPIVFSAYGSGKEPVITGGKNLTGGFVQEGNTWTFTGIGYNKTGYIMNNAGLLINNRFNRVAIHPNDSYYTTSSKGKTSLSDGNQNWAENNLVGGQVSVKAENWAWSIGKISSNTTSDINFSELEYNMKKETTFYFLQNVGLGLDKQGEWVYDNKVLRVYYEGDLNAQTVEFPVVDTVVKINDIRNVRFSGIEFRGANGILIDIQGGQNIDFQDCIFRVAGTGIDINKTTISTFSGNHFEYIHTNGLTANSVGTMNVHENSFKHIHTIKGMNNDYDDWSSSIAIANNFGEVSVKYNTFDTVMIAFQTHWAEADWYFERNYIKDYTYILGDVGAVYSGGDWRTDITKSIKKNIFLDAHSDMKATIGGHIGGYGHGVYWDYNSNGIEVDSNTFINANAAIYSNRNKLNKATNNKFINCAKDLNEIWAMDVYMDNLIDGDNDLTGHSFNNNVFVFGKNRNERAFGYHWNSSKNILWETMNIDNNVYQDPFGKRKIHREINNYSEEGQYSLDEMCSRRNFSCNAVYNPLNHFYPDVTGISEDEFTRVIYNPGKESKIIVLDHTYIDLDGNYITGKVELDPYETKILFYFSDEVIEDTQIPTVPQNLSAGSVEQNSVHLSWDPASDDVGVKGYNIYINGKKNLSTSSENETVNGLSPGTEYSFSVSAFDFFSNESAASEVVSVTTKAREVVDTSDNVDKTPPSVPSNLRALDVGKDFIDLVWAPSSDNISVSGYYIYVNGILHATTSNISMIIDNLSPASSYEISVTAFDNSFNESNPSAILEVRTLESNNSSKPAVQNDKDLPEISIIKVINSEETTETVAKVKSMGRAEVEEFGIRISENRDFVQDVEVISANRDDYDVRSDHRVTENLQLLYNFSFGTGNLVHDISGIGSPLDLKISDEENIMWLPGQGLKVTGNTSISSGKVPQDLIDSISGTNEITVEAWIKPCEINQAGPARIVTLSSDHFNRAFTLGQKGNDMHYDYIFRLNTSNTDANGTPEANTTMYFKKTDLQHVVYTITKDGHEKLYINGVKRFSGYRGGDFSSWDINNFFILANELTGDRPWLGSYFLVAVYNKALKVSEVIQNYNAGFGQLEFKTKFDGLNPGTSYFLSPFVKTLKGIKYGEAVNIMTPQELNTRVSDSLSMKIFPNPSTGNFTVSFEHNMEDFNTAIITVLDVYGKTVYSKEIHFENLTFQRNIEMELNLANGMYFMNIHMGEISKTNRFLIYN